jgi:hypothetical protein
MEHENLRTRKSQLKVVRSGHHSIAFLKPLKTILNSVSGMIIVIALLARIRIWRQALTMTQEVTGRLAFMSEVEYEPSGINKHTDNKESPSQYFAACGYS